MDAIIGKVVEGRAVEDFDIQRERWNLHEKGENLRELTSVASSAAQLWWITDFSDKFITWLVIIYYTMSLLLKCTPSYIMYCETGGEPGENENCEGKKVSSF